MGTPGYRVGARMSGSLEIEADPAARGSATPWTDTRRLSLCIFSLSLVNLLAWLVVSFCSLPTKYQRRARPTRLRSCECRAALPSAADDADIVPAACGENRQAYRPPPPADTFSSIDVLLLWKHAPPWET